VHFFGCDSTAGSVTVSIDPTARTPSAAVLADASSPELDFLGHASFVFAHEGRRVLIDPWFYPAFASSWFPYPDNRFLLSTLHDEKFDFLYISHLHEDHFDRKALAHVDKTTTVLCPAYRSRSLERELADIGFTDIVVMRHGEEIELSSTFRATMILDTSHKEDSGLLLDADGFRFLDLNDCHPQMNEIPRRVDLLAAQFSGAMWYPNCYEYPADRMQEKVDQVRANLIDSLQRICLASDARVYLPSAGPACFLDPELRQYNDARSTIFARWDDVAAEFSRGCPDIEVLRMQPGNRIVVTEGRPAVAGCENQSSTDLEEYAARRQSEYATNVVVAPVTTETLRDYFVDLQRRNRPFVARDFDKCFLVTSEGSEWTITMGAFPDVEVTEGRSRLARYSLAVPMWLLRRIVDSKIGWEEALLSMRIKLRRDPDVFDVRLLGLLRYGSRPAQTRQMLVDAAASDEMIERDGLRCQKYCPHAGEDLTNAIVADGVVECPRHHWKWDTTTGECIAGGSLPLRVERIEDAR